MIKSYLGDLLSGKRDLLHDISKKTSEIKSEIAQSNFIQDYRAGKEILLKPRDTTEYFDPDSQEFIPPPQPKVKSYINNVSTPTPKTKTYTKSNGISTLAKDVKTSKKLAQAPLAPEFTSEAILKALKFCKIKASFQNVQVGAYTDVFTFAISTEIKKAISAKEEICYQLGVDSIEIYSAGAGKINILIPREDTRTLYLLDYIDMTQKGTLQYIVGESVSSIKVDDLAKNPHLIISGGTGAGKTVTLDGILTTILINNTPEELQISLLDIKTVGLAKYQNVPHLYGEAILGLDKANAILKELNEIVIDMNERYAEMGKTGKEAKELFPTWVIVIDEVGMLISQEKKIVDPLVKIASLGRECGIHLLLATQTPRAEILGGEMKANLKQRILRTNNLNEDRVTGVKGGVKLRGDGDGYYQPLNSPEYKRVQTPYISKAEINNILAQLG